MKKWLKRISLGIVGLIALLLITALSYEQIVRIAAENEFSPEGELIDVGGHKLHVLSQGNGPTVVFESGLDSTGHLSWYKVEREVKNFATTVSYDRAGVLWSERGDAPKTGQAMAEDLNALLLAGGFTKPYILVGHSIAGITLRSYINKYPDDIAGIVLVDASHPDQFNRLPQDLNETPGRWVINVMNALGIFRLSEVAQFPQTEAEDRINSVGPALRHKSMSGMMDELINVTQLGEEAINITSYGDIPVVVITGTSPTRNDMMPIETRDQMTTVWNDLQRDMLSLSSDTSQILAPESGHYVQVDSPEIIVAAIRDLIN